METKRSVASNDNDKLKRAIDDIDKAIAFADTANANAERSLKAREKQA